MFRGICLLLFFHIVVRVPAAFAQASASPPTDLQPAWNVLYGHAGFEEAEDMLPKYLKNLLVANEEASKKAISGLQTRADLERYRAAIRAKLREELGEFPARTPLHARMTGTLERGDYAVEKLIFESRPHYYVTADVYVPRRFRAPFPAVLCPVGHWGAGKAFEDYQRLGIYLARRGFLVLVFDLPGQGERLQYYNSVLGRSLVDPGTSEHFVTIEHGVAAGQTFLTSGNFTSYLVWDGLRALDYLWERADVDRNRVACTGASGGGLQTELLSALDERIRVSIPVSYGGCGADDPTRPGLSMLDVDALIAPRPLLMITATGDSRADVLAKLQRHKALSRVFELLGASDRTSFLITEGRHGYMEGTRLAAYDWLSRWLRSEIAAADSFREPPTGIESAEALACTSTGQVLSALGGETVFSLNRSQIRLPNDLLPTHRDEWPQWREHLRREVAAKIGLSARASPVTAASFSHVDRGSYSLERIVYRTAPEIFVPALLFLPKASVPSPAVVFVQENGKTADRAPEHYLQPLAEAGYVVLSIDPSGMGETKPVTSPEYDERNYRGLVEDAEADLFYNAISAGTTLVGLRTRDVLAAVDYLQGRKEVDGGKIQAIGRGMGGLLVLYAAALDDRIRSAVLTGTLVSYSAIAATELYTHRLASFVPGALHSFDLPAVSALIAPRPQLLINSVDQLHRPMEVQQVGEEYRTATAVYRLLGVQDDFVIGQEPSARQVLDRYLAQLRKAFGDGRKQ